MYGRLENAGISIPETVVLERAEVKHEVGIELLDRLGKPMILKAPNSSFSMYVERVSTPEEFVQIGRRFLRRAARLVVKRYVNSAFDWRIGILAVEVIYVCRYLIPRKLWKILTYQEGGKVTSGRVQGFSVEKVDSVMLEVALEAAGAIGNGLYGADLKQTADGYVVIEVNDNPTIVQGDEDEKSPEVYERIILYLAGEWG